MQEIMQHEVQCNNQKVIVYDRTPVDPSEATKTAVFLHGLSMDSRVWERQLQDPALGNLRMLVIDLPGHGQSAWAHQPHTGYTMGALGETVRRVMASLSVSSYVLVGISLGANTALQAIQSLPGCKGLLAIVVPFSKPLRFENFRDPAFLLEKIYKEDVEADDRKRYCELLAGPEYPSFVEEAFLQSDPRTRSVILSEVGQGNYEDENSQIQRAPFPVVLVLGSRDRLYNTEFIRESPQQNIQWIPEAGHLPQWNNPAVFNKLLNEFINECIPDR